MNTFRGIGDRLGIAGELLTYFWHRKRWWLIPVVVMLLIVGLLIVFGSATGVGPFIYTLF